MTRVIRITKNIKMQLFDNFIVTDKGINVKKILIDKVKKDIACCIYDISCSVPIIFLLVGVDNSDR